MTGRKSKNAQAAPDPFAIFQTGELYHRSSLVLLKTFNQALAERDANGNTINGRLILPQMMLSTFCCELYFKSLSILDGRPSNVDQHNLSFFFKHLSPPTKDLLRKHWNEGQGYDITLQFYKKLRPDSDFTLDGSLKLAGDAFRKLRYLHEGNTPPYQIGILPQVLRFTIFEFRPEWKEKSVSAHLTKYDPIVPEGESPFGTPADKLADD